MGMVQLSRSAALMLTPTTSKDPACIQMRKRDATIRRTELRTIKAATPVRQDRQIEVVKSITVTFNEFRSEASTTTRNAVHTLHAIGV